MSTLGMTEWLSEERTTMAIKPEFPQEVLDFAGDVLDYVLAELTQNRENWYFRFEKLTEAQKAGFFKALADGFNDEIEE